MEKPSKIDWKFIKGFFRKDSDESMMRFLSLSAVWAGIIYCFVYPTHYLAGIEMLALGLLGKGGQKYLEQQKKP